jgi:hypothetical protein
VSTVVFHPVVSTEVVYRLLEYMPNVFWLFTCPSNWNDVILDGSDDLLFFSRFEGPIVENGAMLAAGVEAELVFMAVDEKNEVATKFKDRDRNHNRMSVPI